MATDTPPYIIAGFSGPHEFLSNFSVSPFLFEGIEYPTCEHAYQASKTFKPSERLKIAKAGSPAIAKRLGKKATLRPDWEDVKNDVMIQVLREKFKRLSLRAQLLATRNAQLVELNTWNDTYWGAVMDKKTNRMVGHNMLGKCLMQVREEYRAG